MSSPVGLALAEFGELAMECRKGGGAGNPVGVVPIERAVDDVFEGRAAPDAAVLVELEYPDLVSGQVAGNGGDGQGRGGRGE